MLNNLQRERHVNAYADMVEDRIVNRGYDPYLISFMFNELGGSAASARERMENEVERVFARVLTRSYRRPRDVATYDMPFLLASPDWPVPKRYRDNLRNIAVNGGLHMHAIWLHPPATRLNSPLDIHFDDCQDQYCAADKPLFLIYTKKITATPRKAAGYCLKSLERGRIDSGEVMILPRSHSEMPLLTPTERKAARAEL